jgi:FkbM family methyltransferase
VRWATDIRFSGYLALVSLLRKSLQLDVDLLRIPALTLGQRLSFVGQKYRALARLALGRPAEVRLGSLRYEAPTVSALGTLQSSIVDFYQDVIATRSITEPDPVVIDIGANAGQFCNAVKLFLPAARVYSFEPDPDVFRQLERNTARLSGVRLFNVGLGDRAEQLPFYVHELSAMSSFQQYAGVRYDAKHTKHLEVRRLDDVMPSVADIDLLKVDVEGFELKVLGGADEALRRARYLLIEVGLARVPAAATNLALFATVRSAAPEARIVKFGRPLGNPATPTCQDVLVRLR